MRTVARVTALLGVVGLFGCATAGPGADAQIRERIDSIHAAIVARQPAGIVRWGTDDWRFIAADGTTFDKPAYLERTGALMDRLVSIDAFETLVDSLVVQGETANAEITQKMDRHERDQKTGTVTAVRLKYRERHVWVKTADGWRVKSVTVLAGAERTILSSGSV